MPSATRHPMTHEQYLRHFKEERCILCNTMVRSRSKYFAHIKPGHKDACDHVHELRRVLMDRALTEGWKEDRDVADIISPPSGRMSDPPGFGDGDVELDLGELLWPLPS